MKLKIKQLQFETAAGDAKTPGAEVSKNKTPMQLALHTRPPTSTWNPPASPAANCEINRTEDMFRIKRAFNECVLDFPSTRKLQIYLDKKFYMQIPVNHNSAQRRPKFLTMLRNGTN